MTGSGGLVRARPNERFCLPPASELFATAASGALARVVLHQRQMTQATKQQDIEQLNGMLRGERAAVETYKQCIEKLGDDGIGQQLGELRSSHSARVGKLTARVVMLGGEADMNSGAWGTFAKAVEGSAAIFGKAAALAALEEGEDHGKKLYTKLDGLTEGTRTFVQTELVPEQRRTHDALNALKSSH